MDDTLSWLKSPSPNIWKAEPISHILTQGLPRPPALWDAHKFSTPIGTCWMNEDQAELCFFATNWRTSLSNVNCAFGISSSIDEGKTTSNDVSRAKTHQITHHCLGNKHHYLWCSLLLLRYHPVHALAWGYLVAKKAKVCLVFIHLAVPIGVEKLQALKEQMAFRMWQALPSKCWARMTLTRTVCWKTLCARTITAKSQKWVNWDGRYSGQKILR